MDLEAGVSIRVAQENYSTVKSMVKWYECTFEIVKLLRASWLL